MMECSVNDMEPKPQATRVSFIICENGHPHVTIAGEGQTDVASLLDLARGVQNLLASPENYSPLHVPILVPLDIILTREQAEAFVQELHEKAGASRLITEALIVRQGQEGFEG